MIRKPLCAPDHIETCEACSKKVLGWTVVGNAFLTGIKLAGGILANSSGLIADGMQSVSCVATSIIIMVSMGFSRRKEDERFPYGYVKLEFIVALCAFSILIGMGLFIALSNLLGILRHDFVRPDIMVLPVAIMSAFLTYMIYRYNFCAGSKLDSPGMIANGCHAGADLFSSGAVILGIILSQFGPKFMASDRVAALLVGMIIVKDSLGHWIGNLRIILDRSPDREFIRRVEKAMTQFRGEYDPQVVKFKRVGKKFWIGMGLRLPLNRTVRDIDAFMSRMRRVLTAQFPSISEVDFFVETA